MTHHRRRNLHLRLADLERQTSVDRNEEPVQQVTVYMPRNERDPQPCGVISEDRWVKTILYDPHATDTTQAGL